MPPYGVGSATLQLALPDTTAKLNPCFPDNPVSGERFTRCAGAAPLENFTHW
jgi:hypothetical protein